MVYIITCTLDRNGIKYTSITEVEAAEKQSWEEVLKSKFGVRIFPKSTQNQTKEVPAVKLKAKGTKLTILKVTPSRTNGIYTSIYVKPCGSFIGKYFVNVFPFFMSSKYVNTRLKKYFENCFL